MKIAGVKIADVKIVDTRLFSATFCDITRSSPRNAEEWKLDELSNCTFGKKTAVGRLRIDLNKKQFPPQRGKKDDLT